MRRRIAAALDTMTRRPTARGIGDIKRRAAIGYCFGGLNVLDLARTGADVQAVVSIHGELATPKPARRATSRPRFWCARRRRSDLAEGRSATSSRRR